MTPAAHADRRECTRQKSPDDLLAVRGIFLSGKYAE